MEKSKLLFIGLVCVGLLLIAVPYQSYAIVNIQGTPPNAICVILWNTAAGYNIVNLVDPNNPSTIPLGSNPNFADFVMYVDFEPTEIPTSVTIKYKWGTGTYTYTMQSGELIPEQNVYRVKMWNGVSYGLHVSAGYLCTFEISYSDVQSDSGSVTFYGRAAENAPTGQFYINDIAVTVDSIITVYTQTLTFKFLPYSGADVITSVKVHITSGDGTDTTIDFVKKISVDEWGGSYTVSKDGSYTCTGTVYWSDKSVVLMEIAFPVGSVFSSLQPSQILGIALCGIGCIGFVVTRKKPKAQ